MYAQWRGSARTQQENIQGLLWREASGDTKPIGKLIDISNGQIVCLPIPVKVSFCRFSIGIDKLIETATGSYHMKKL